MVSRYTKQDLGRSTLSMSVTLCIVWVAPSVLVDRVLVQSSLTSYTPVSARSARVSFFPISTAASLGKFSTRQQTPWIIDLWSNCSRRRRDRIIIGPPITPANARALTSPYNLHTASPSADVAQSNQKWIDRGIKLVVMCVSLDRSRATLNPTLCNTTPTPGCLLK